MISAVAFAAALALTPAAEALGGGRFKFPTNVQRNANNGYQSSSDRQVSAVKCTAAAGAKNFKKSVDAHVAAITAAWAYACDTQLTSLPTDPFVDFSIQIRQYMRSEMNRYGAGLAYAKAIAAARTECTSSGNAWGCAAAYAYSSAWAKAAVSAHAHAWTEAISSCHCDSPQDIGATADAAADEFRELVADVYAYADASVCVDGDEAESVYNAQTCVQDIYATVFARSVSLAALKGKCVRQSSAGNAKAYGEMLVKAEVEAKAEINTFELAGCVPVVDVFNPYH